MHAADIAIDTEHSRALDPVSVAATRLSDAVVVFTDLVESTPLLVRIGEDAYIDLLDRVDAAREELASRHGGRIAHLAGDGAMVLFGHTDDAIAFARAFDRACGPLGVRSRAGVHVGDIQFRRSGQVAGLAVHAAARIEASAPAGGVLVSSAAADRSAHDYRSIGWVELKGIPGATELFELVA